MLGLQYCCAGDANRTRIRTTTAAGAVATRDFRYQDDAIVEEVLTDATHSAAVVRSYVVDESGTVVRMTVAPGEPDAGTYIPVWNGHGDAVNLSRLDPVSGGLTLANSYTYSTWGTPTTATHNGAGDLGFRFTYVGEFDVQWDDQLGLGLVYMHARHYSPALGRFVQPDPDRSEANLYAYAANNPVTELDPDGTCFIVCQLVIGAVIDAVVYLATADDASLGGLAGAVASGALESALNPLAKLSKVTRLARAASKVLAKVPKAGRAAQRVGSKVKSGYRRLENHYSWQNVRSRRGPAPVRSNPAFPRGKEYKELTHAFIPKRAPVPNFIKNSRWNLREKWGTSHALSDPSRYRFMPRTWKKANPLPNVVRRSWNRMWPDRGA